MKSHMSPKIIRASHQRGVVLFFALIALVVMSLAAVALIRSVDTSTLIAGNLSFRQAATSSGDSGIEAANNWLGLQQAAMTAAGKIVMRDLDHAFNADHPSQGYYTSLQASLKWDAAHSAPALPDANGNAQQDTAGNTVRYIIERMCRTPNSLPMRDDCLLSQGPTNGGGNALNVKLPPEICLGPGCPFQDTSPQLRITAQVIGSRNTVSYIQTFVY